MFCLLPTLWKQQQIAILLIISFFLYANGIRNEGNNMLQKQPLQQKHQEQQQQQKHKQQEQKQSEQHQYTSHHSSHEEQQQLQPLHATIKNSNYQRLPSPPPPSSSLFKPSPLVEFTLADVTRPGHSQEPNDNKSKYSSQLPLTSSQGALTNIEQTAVSAIQTTKTKDQNDNRRYSTTTKGGTQFLFPSEEQQVYPIPQQQQQQQQQHQQQQQQQQSQTQAQKYQQQQQYQPEQQFTEMPIYIYRDPYTNENYHYQPTEPTTIISQTGSHHSLPPSYIHNDNGVNDYNQQQQQQQQLHQYQPATPAQNSQEYLVHSSISVGAQRPSSKPHSSYLESDKDIYLKRPGMVYDESYVAHPNAVVEKKRDTPQTNKINKISYDSHDYPPPSYAQQQTSNFLPTPVPERKPTPRPTQPPVPPVRRPQEGYATRPPYVPNAPPPPPPPTRPPFTFGRPSQLQQQQQQQQQQQYLQSSQNALPNYANNLDNYLSNKQQPGPFYPNERPPLPPASLQHLQKPQQYPYYENSPPSYRPPPPATPPLLQSYPAYESPQYHQQQHTQTHPSHRPSYNNYYDYQIGEVPPPPNQGALNYPYPRPTNGPYRPLQPPAATQQPSGFASLVQYAPQFTSLLLNGVGGGGGVGGASSSNNPLGSLLGALTDVANVGQQTSSSTTAGLNRRPINAQLIRALENIARNDDLQCVPKVVCQMIAGQIQRGQLPDIVTSPAITNFLSGFPAASPVLIYGRAALLGISGGDKSCHQTYVQCPKNEVEIIYYLNNHRGGFFKFFNEPEPQTSHTQQESQSSPQSSFFSILAALTGNEQPTPPRTTPRPRPKPQPTPSSDITSTIGNFFTNLLSDYMGGGATVEYQRRRKKRSAERRLRFLDSGEDEYYNIDSFTQDFADDEDGDDTRGVIDLTDHSEYSRPLDEYDGKPQFRDISNPFQKQSNSQFFPNREPIREDSKQMREDIISLIQRFNSMNQQRKFKFPSVTTERPKAGYDDIIKESRELQEELGEVNYSRQYMNHERESHKNKDESSSVAFRGETRDKQNAYNRHHFDNDNDLATAKSSYTPSKMIFPEREGRILSHPSFTASDTLHQGHQISLGGSKETHHYGLQMPLGETEGPYYHGHQIPHATLEGTQHYGHQILTSSSEGPHHHEHQIAFATSEDNLHQGHQIPLAATEMPHHMGHHIPFAASEVPHHLGHQIPFGTSERPHHLGHQIPFAASEFSHHLGHQIPFTSTEFPHHQGHQIPFNALEGTHHLGHQISLGGVEGTSQHGHHIPLAPSEGLHHHLQQNPFTASDSLGPQVPFAESEALHHHGHQTPHGESESAYKLVESEYKPYKVRFRTFSELYAPQKDYLEPMAPNKEIHSPISIASQISHDNNVASSATQSYVFNNHVATMNSLNSFVSNSDNNINNFYGSDSNQVDGFKPMSPPSNNNYFLPTKVPATEIITKDIIGNTNYYNQIGANTIMNSQKQQQTINNKKYSIRHYTASGSSSAGGSSSSSGSSTNNSFKPIAKPSYTSTSNYGSAVNSNAGILNYNRPHVYPASAINSNYNSQSYPANSYNPNNHHYSSIHTSKRPVTTTRRSDNKNVYVTNGRGVTEYYVTPDGRKVYL